METVENTLDVPIEAVLERPLFCFLAHTAADGAPRLSPLWFLWEEGSVWMIGDAVGKSYVDRIERDPRTALAVVDSDVRAGTVRHVGMRGRTEVVPFDPERADRLLGRYLGDDPDAWDERFVDLPSDRWRLLRFDPETVVARDQSFVPSRD